MKRCSVCDSEKPLEDFHRSNANRDGRHSYCKDCARLKLREWRANNVERVRELERGRRRAAYAREWRARTNGERPHHAAVRIARLYGLTLDDYWQRLDEQDRSCAICRQPETFQQGGRLKRLSVDHDHDTGVVRGFLCARCNSGLGYFRDDPELLEAAIRYLSKWRDRAASQSLVA